MHKLREYPGASCPSTNKKINSNGGIVMDIEKIHEIELAIGVNRSEVLRLGVSMLFFMIRGIMLP